MDIAKAVIDVVLPAGVGLLVGFAGTYFGAVVKYRKDLETEFDREIRKERIRTYAELFQHTDLLARYDRPAPLDNAHLHDLSVAMRKWYFECGGMFLSEETRKIYFDLKDILRDSIDLSPDKRAVELTDPKQLIGAASLLRAALTKDLGTRRSPPLPDS